MYSCPNCKYSPGTKFRNTASRFKNNGIKVKQQNQDEEFLTGMVIFPRHSTPEMWVLVFLMWYIPRSQGNFVYIWDVSFYKFTLGVNEDSKVCSYSIRGIPQKLRLFKCGY